jgi:DNA-binding CsgD family transcriptional regulator
MTERVTKLTNRELEILKLVALGYSEKAMAQFRDIGPRIVDWHLENTRLKLQARNRTHAVASVIDLRMLSGGGFQGEPPLAA